VISGQGDPTPNPDLEQAEVYKVSKLKVTSRGSPPTGPTPPWLGPAPAIEVYRARGHRRLDARTYDTPTCSTCIWGCRMPVTIIIDKWNPSQVQLRKETWCYGPIVCPNYKAGPTRKVKGRKGEAYVEADWIDREEVAHRGPED
jgi:hypothetical protein